MYVREVPFAVAEDHVASSAFEEGHYLHDVLVCQHVEVFSWGDLVDFVQELYLESLVAFFRQALHLSLEYFSQLVDQRFVQVFAYLLVHSLVVSLRVLVVEVHRLGDLLLADLTVVLEQRFASVLT